MKITFVSIYISFPRNLVGPIKQRHKKTAASTQGTAALRHWLLAMDPATPSLVATVAPSRIYLDGTVLLPFSPSFYLSSDQPLLPVFTCTLSSFFSLYVFTLMFSFILLLYDLHVRHVAFFYSHVSLSLYTLFSVTFQTRFLSLLP